jgi:hypothetical protein
MSYLLISLAFLTFWIFILIILFLLTEKIFVRLGIIKKQKSLLSFIRIFWELISKWQFGINYTVPYNIKLNNKEKIEKKIVGFLLGLLYLIIFSFIFIGSFYITYSVVIK